MEDEQGNPQTCDCLTGLMAIIGSEDGRVAAWCIWCGIGFGDAVWQITLRAGQPMPDVAHLEIVIPTYPLLGKVTA